MVSQRPFLILGSDLRDFLEVRRAKARVPLTGKQLFCLSCKAARKPMGLMVDYHDQSAKTGRLVGLCEACGGTCNRMISRTDLSLFRAIFDVACKDGPRA